MIERLRRWWPVIFFLLGFLYDILTLGRIDSVVGMIKQGAYLGAVGLLLSLEALAYIGRFKPGPRMGRLWSYQIMAIHFFLGSLLSQYTLFFFKSASLWSSFAFLVLLCFVLVMNEFKHLHGSSGITVRAALFSLCLACYFIYVVPVIQGNVGTIPFFLALFAASVVAYILIHILGKKAPNERKFFRRHLGLPFAAVLGAFACLYVTRLIPPVPIAVKYMGIFHELKKEDGRYLLGFEHPWWKVWLKGDQEFLARPGDKLYFFVRIFSPGHFSDQVQVRWLYHEGRHGWRQWDAIPIQITGGRAEGFRGYTVKSNFQPGDWQVRVETTDGREVGRMYFTVIKDESTAERDMHFEVH